MEQKMMVLTGGNTGQKVRPPQQTAERSQMILSRAATFETSFILSSIYKRVNRGTEKSTSIKNAQPWGEPHWVDTQTCPVGQEQGLVSKSFRDRFHT